VVDRGPAETRIRSESPTHDAGLRVSITTETRREHKPEQILRKLREGEHLLGQSLPLAQVCKQLAISEATWHHWTTQYGRIKPNNAKQFEDLARENARLKKILADQLLEIDTLKDLIQGH